MWGSRGQFTKEGFAQILIGLVFLGSLATWVMAENEKRPVEGGEQHALGGSQRPPTLQSISAVINVKEFGAKGDGVTDDRAAIQGAFTFAAEPGRRGNTIFFPRGLYISSGSITLPPNAQGTHVLGAGTYNDADYGQGAWMRFASGGFVINNASSIIFENMNVHAGPLGGPAFHINQSSLITLNRIHAQSSNTAVPLIRVRGTTLPVRISEFHLTVGKGNTAPAIDFCGQTNNNVIEKGWIYGNRSSAAPLIRMESLVGVSTNNVIRDVVFETPAAGGVHLFSVQRSILENLWAGDLGGTAPRAPFIRIAKSGRNKQPSKRITIIGVEADFGTDENPTLLLEGDVGGQGGVHVHGSRLPVISNGAKPGSNPVVLYNVDYSRIVGERPVEIDALGNLLNIRGLSGTERAARSMRGSVTIAGPATSGSVSFAQAEADAKYFVTATATGITGTPSAGSNRVRAIMKSANGFTVNVEAAPGAGSAVTFDWHLVR